MLFMCGRYYIDENMARELDEIIPGIGQSLWEQYGGDIFPSQKAPVLLEENGVLLERPMQWGFEGFRGKGSLINARAESALEKKTFTSGIPGKKSSSFSGQMGNLCIWRDVIRCLTMRIIS